MELIKIAIAIKKEFQRKLSDFEGDIGGDKGVYKGVDRAYGDVFRNSPVQGQVMYLLSIENCTPIQISQRLQISRQAVNNAIQKLVDKGYLDSLTHLPHLRGGVTTREGVYCQPPQQHIYSSSISDGASGNHMIRLHNQQFKIKILNPSDTYNLLRKTKTQFSFEGHTVVLWEDCLDLYAKEGNYFEAETADKAYFKAVVYWDRILNKLQRRLNVLIIKDMNTTIKEVRSHYASTNSEISKTLKASGEQLQLKAPEDGKTYMITDSSLTDEHEYIHPKTARRDTDRIEPFINKIRDGSISYEMIQELAKVVMGVVQLEAMRSGIHTKETPVSPEPPATPEKAEKRDRLTDYFG